MKTQFKILAIAILFIATTLCCTNSNNKPVSFLLEEETITTDSKDTSIIINEIWSTAWYFQSINSNNINSYIYETSPFLIISTDSSHVMINSGCNIYIGECSFEPNSNIYFDKIKIKDEICPVDALEREIVYTLEISDNYYMDSNNIILYNKNKPICLLTKNKTDIPK